VAKTTDAIHTEIDPMYGDKCFTRPAIHVWCKKFAHCRESVDKQQLHMQPAISCQHHFSSCIHKLV